MIFQTARAHLELPATDDKVAKIILNFFLFQYQRALEKKINTQQELRASIAANEAARQEYNKDEQIGGFGWDRRLPYDETYLKFKETEVKSAEQEYEEISRILEFIKNRFVEKFV